MSYYLRPSVLYSLTTSDYPCSIFKLFILIYIMLLHIIYIVCPPLFNGNAETGVLGWAFPNVVFASYAIKR